MPDSFPIGVVTDEISRSLPEALDIARSWGLSRFELREGSVRRFPQFTPEEISTLDVVLAEGARITAVSPGILKNHVDDAAATKAALTDTLPRTIELAARFACPLIIVFGFEKADAEDPSNRTTAMRAFERAATMAADAGMRVAIENEPNFWVDRSGPAADMLAEIGHPALALNWDPANLHWGGHLPTQEDVELVRPHLANLHVKDYAPSRPEAPWFPVGQGETPWADLFSWVLSGDHSLEHVTLETHCEPLVESSRQSLEGMRRLLSQVSDAV